MFEDLKTRPEITALLGMSRTTFHTYSTHYPAFPPVRGLKKGYHLFSFAEVLAFFAEHAPKYAENAKKRVEVSA